MPGPASSAGARSDTDEAATIRSNRMRAWRLCLVSAVALAVVAGAVAAAVLVAIKMPAALALPVSAAVGVGATALLWLRSPGVVLRGLGAQPGDEELHPRLHNLVDGLCATMGLPHPRICVVDSPVPNALALGRSPEDAYLVVTSGLDRALGLVELEGVLAHELVHIKRHDTLLSGAAVTALGPASFVLGVPRASARVHRLIGPGRELGTDLRACAVVRYPPGLCSALDIMASTEFRPGSWPPSNRRTARLTRWLWVDPMAGTSGEPAEGNLDDTRVRAQALALR
ncbi:MAG: M48 family metalloprotease [Acidimicrobiales bacterium]